MGGQVGSAVLWDLLSERPWTGRELGLASQGCLQNGHAAGQDRRPPSIKHPVLVWWFTASEPSATRKIDFMDFSGTEHTINLQF